MNQLAKAALFRELHRAPELLVLPNAWDVGSAVALAALPGCRALATTSGGVAHSLGFDDNEQAPADEMLRVLARIAAAVDVPVSADLEAGYGDAPGTARMAWETGIVGANFEDSRAGAMVPLEQQVEVLRAVRAAVPDLVLNARVDVFLRGLGGVEEAVARSNAYLAAGADCVFPIMIAHTPDIERMVQGVNGPVAVMARPGLPSLAELEQLGVARVTWGSSLAKHAYAEAARIAEEALGRQSQTAAPAT
jgi:2-methylisocitrate lyase-like PEP mutase family enzyme